MFGRKARPAVPDQSVNRFGNTCPVCGAALGAVDLELDRATGRFKLPPSMRLEVGPADAENRNSWRVTVLSVNASGLPYEPLTSTTPRFIAEEVEYTYLLCGGGHIFPDVVSVFDQAGGGHLRNAQRIDGWNMVAAIGAPASGKTYLLVRMLHQNLDTPDGFDLSSGASGRVRLRQLTPLERMPLAVRAERYKRTVSEGHPIPPTNTEQEGKPVGILDRALPSALEDGIRQLVVKTVVDGQRRAEEWGRNFRQPLVLRTDSQGRRFWTGVADLPGELFNPDDTQPQEAGKLRGFDSLLWVVDPVVAANALDWLVADSLPDVTDYPMMLDGSLRPGASESSGHKVVRGNRDHFQIEIGRQLTLIDGILTRGPEQNLNLFVALSKCDLIHAALRNKKLTDLGAPDVVRRGVARYLFTTARKLAEQRLTADEAATGLLVYLHGGAAGSAVARQERIEHIADGLLRVYSDPTRFWNLVHSGRAEEVVITDGPTMNLQGWHLSVPSLSDHLTAALVPETGHRLLLRDLVMSALGCGLMFGLGHQDAIASLLHDNWLTLKFFLCSPLGTVPMSTSNQLITPLVGGDRFPQAHERSAALTQLMLAVLGKARS
jgi:hypothetical protein